MALDNQEASTTEGESYKDGDGTEPGDAVRQKGTPYRTPHEEASEEEEEEEEEGSKPWISDEEEEEEGSKPWISDEEDQEGYSGEGGKLHNDSVTAWGECS